MLFTGIAGVDDYGEPYTTILYGNGPGYNYTVAKNNQVERPNPIMVNTSDYEYLQQSAVPTYPESHGGEDVPIFAIGKT